MPNRVAMTTGSLFSYRQDDIVGVDLEYRHARKCFRRWVDILPIAIKCRFDAGWPPPSSGQCVDIFTRPIGKFGVRIGRAVEDAAAKQKKTAKN